MRLSILAVLICGVAACTPTAPNAPPKPPAPEKPNIKNVIFVVGDGMGPQQIGLGELYARHAPNSVVPDRTLSMTRMMNEGEVGLMLTEPFGQLVTDSAVSATHMAIGEWSRSEMLGLDKDGNRVDTLLERAKKVGRSTAVVSDMRVTHATPAAFVAHQLHRSLENAVADDYVASPPDIIFGGGLRHFVPQDFGPDANPHGIPAEYGVASKRTDDKDLLAELAKGGYALAFTKDALDKTKADKIVALFGNSHMPRARTLRDMKPRTIPTLAELTAKALDVVSKNPEGFAMVLEAGQIDWAAHRNDTGGMLHAFLRLDAALREVYAFAKGRDDTLVVIVGDHETGSFGFSYSRRNVPEEMMKLPNGESHRPGFNFGSYELLDKIYAQKTTFEEFFTAFRARPAKEQTAKTLASTFNEISEFPITEQQAKKILEDEPNNHIASHHPYLRKPTFPRFDDFEEFYVYGDVQRPCLLGRAVAGAQNVVWGTGTHTSTPIVVIAYGPESVIEAFDGIRHTSEVGRRVQELASLR